MHERIKILCPTTREPVAHPSTITHVGLSMGSEKGRIACLKATIRRCVKMEGTKDRTHSFPQFPPYVMIPAHPSSPPNATQTNIYFFSGGFAVKVSLLYEQKNAILDESLRWRFAIVSI